MPICPNPAFIPLETLTPTCVLANFVPFSFAIILCTNFIATFAHLISHSASFFLVWQPLYHDRKNWETKKRPLTILIGRKTPFPAKAKKGILRGTDCLLRLLSNSYPITYRRKIRFHHDRERISSIICRESSSCSVNAPMFFWDMATTC